MKLHHFKLTPNEHVGCFDVYLDGVKQEGVRKVIACVEAGALPAVWIQYVIDRADVTIPEANANGKVVDDDGETPG